MHAGNKQPPAGLRTTIEMAAHRQASRQAATQSCYRPTCINGGLSHAKQSELADKQEKKWHQTRQQSITYTTHYAYQTTGANMVLSQYNYICIPSNLVPNNRNTGEV